MAGARLGALPRRARAHAKRAPQEGLLWEPDTCAARAAAAPPPELLRAKGVLQTTLDVSRRRVLQSVRQTYELTDGADALARGGGAANRFVFIGRSLEAALLKASLAGCCAHGEQQVV